jgi:Tetratricopeptide repeat
LLASIWNTAEPAPNDLAYAYQAAGRLGEAVPLFEQNLADRERVHGVEVGDVDQLLLRRGTGGSSRIRCRIPRW